MIGYHATAHRNVDNILRDGLHPYRIHKPWADPSWRGIWLWETRPTGTDWVHVALQRWLDHQDPRVSLFAVDYEPKWCETPSGAIFDIYHDGTVKGNDPHPAWTYHEGVQAHVVWSRKIAAARITLLGTTDFSRPAGIEDFDPASLPYPEPVRARTVSADTKLSDEPPRRRARPSLRSR